MTQLEQWKKDMKFIYIKSNYYQEPRFKVLEVRQVSFLSDPNGDEWRGACKKNTKDILYYINSSGIWGNEKNGIMHTWFDLEKFDNDDHDVIFIKHSDEQEILNAFNFDKQNWIIRTRKEKLKALQI